MWYFLEIIKSWMSVLYLFLKNQWQTCFSLTVILRSDRECFIQVRISPCADPKSAKNQTTEKESNYWLNNKVYHYGQNITSVYKESRGEMTTYDTSLPTGPINVTLYCSQRTLLYVRSTVDKVLNTSPSINQQLYFAMKIILR